MQQPFTPIVTPADTSFGAMTVARTFREFDAARATLLARAGSLALVPTMGALHDGHLALVRAGLQHCDAVAASIFVNPTQFAAGEDLARYPRDEAGDLDKLAGAGCRLVWMPQADEMYPAGDATRVIVGGPSQLWEGDARPTHFAGVATVVLKLLLQVRPDVALFGEKDWQQLQVVRRMVTDLAVPTRIVGVPTGRDADGLALSSRNQFLTEAERRIAPRLHAGLRALAHSLIGGTPMQDALASAKAALTEAGFSVDYLRAVHAETLAPLDTLQAPARLIAAARLGSVRLLDNLAVDLI